MGAQEIQFPALLPREPYETTRPVDRVRPEHLPAQGPQGRRLPARAHARGAVHPRGEGRVRVVQGLPGRPLPDPDEVPGRGASPRGHPARAGVPHEGLLLVRPDRRGPGRVVRQAPRRLHQDLRPARAPVRDRRRRCRERWAARPARSSWPTSETGEDTFVRGPGGYAANVEAVITPAPPAQPVDDKPPAQAHHTPGTPTIETLVAFLNAADLGPDLHGCGHAEERADQDPAAGCGRLGAARRRRARRPRGRHEAPGGGALARRGRAAGGGRLRARTRSSSRGTSGRARWPRTASASSSTPGSSPARRG